MKKMLVLLLMLLLLLLCACGKDAVVPEVELPQYTGFYDLSACFPEMTMVFGDNSYVFESGQTRYRLSVRKCYSEQWAPPLGNHERKTRNGLEYYSMNETVFWDGMDKSGKDEISEIVLADGDRYITLNGYGGAVSIDALLALLSNKTVDGAVLKQHSGGARLHGANVECNIGLSPETDAYMDILDGDSTMLCTDGEISYVQSVTERTLDDPHSRFFLCGTDAGVLMISCGVFYEERNNVPEDYLDFLDLELVKAVADKLGVTLTNLPQVYLDLYK